MKKAVMILLIGLSLSGLAACNSLRVGECLIRDTTSRPCN
jgi:hypothetical protein